MIGGKYSFNRTTPHYQVGPKHFFFGYAREWNGMERKGMEIKKRKIRVTIELQK